LADEDELVVEEVAVACVDTAGWGLLLDWRAVSTSDLIIRLFGPDPEIPWRDKPFWLAMNFAKGEATTRSPVCGADEVFEVEDEEVAAGACVGADAWEDDAEEPLLVVL
jgi:hypothetical protein